MRMPAFTCILAVDDHPLQLEITCALLAKVFEGAQVFAAGGIEDALRQVAERGAPELVVLDLGLPGCSGIQALARMREACPAAALVVYSANEDGATIRSALRAGARGYVAKSMPREQIAAALRLVASGATHVPLQALAGAGEPPGVVLSEREREVLRFVLAGHSNRDIAQSLEISETTVKHHLTAIYRALGVDSRAAAIAAARNIGLFRD